LRTVLEILVFSAHNRILSNQCFTVRLRKPAKPPIKQDRSHASEPSPPTVGALLSRTAIPGQTIRPDNGSVVSGRSSVVSQKTAHATNPRTPIHAPRDAPEPDLHFQRTTRSPTRTTATNGMTAARTLCPATQSTEFGHSAILNSSQSSGLRCQKAILTTAH
jgi:hypothetical protein